MIAKLVLAELRHRPGRALFLLAGYAFGVAVMVVLLSVGEAMLSQSRDQSLLGGGDLVVIPAGIRPEMLRVGGATSLFLGLDQARFLQRQILESPRAREDYGIAASSPIVDGRAVEITHGGRTVQALASGEIPSRALAAQAAPDLLLGSWTDSDDDRRWVSPDPSELLHEIDAFHEPYGSAVGDSTWAEWHYFNVVLDEERWLYITYLIGGRVGIPGEWGGRLLVSVREPGSAHTTYAREMADDEIRFDTARADLVLDSDAAVRVVDGVYHLTASVAGVDLDLRIHPLENRLFPPASLGGADAVSGYVVPALAARANGRVCLPFNSTERCEEVQGVRAYHDHNWGVWRDVAWEWGAASDEDVSLLYGAVRGPEIPEQGLFAYVVDSKGVRGLYRPTEVESHGRREIAFGARMVNVPASLRLTDVRRGLEVVVDLSEYQITDMERDVDRYFLQMSGVATLHEVGAPIRQLPGFFETYVD